MRIQSKYFEYKRSAIYKSIHDYRHIKLELYSCKICGKNWNTIAKSDVLKHVKVRSTEERQWIERQYEYYISSVQAVHSGDENMITDNRKALCNQLRHYTQQVRRMED